MSLDHRRSTEAIPGRVSRDPFRAGAARVGAVAIGTSLRT